MPDATGTNPEGHIRQAPSAGAEPPSAAKAGISPYAARGQGAGQDRLIDWLRSAIWRREALLTEARGHERVLEEELAAIRASLTWRVTAPLRSWSERHAAAATVVRRAAKVAYWTITLQVPSRLRARRKGLRAARRIEAATRERTYERWIKAYDTLTSRDLEDMRAALQALEHRPLVSVLMPVFNPPDRFLREAIDSVRAQVYENWELCIADDASTAAHVRLVLDEYARRDNRIRVTYRAENGGISAASNSALALARGELVGLLDHDDLLRPHAVFLAVSAFEANADLGYLYSDEDKVDESGRRFAYWFKPEWNPALLLSQNYLCHFSVFRTALARDVGGFRSEYDGSQDWDLALRITESLGPGAIGHVPHVLYHWRAIPGSAAAELTAKPHSVDAGRRAAEDHLRRVGHAGYVVPVGPRTQKVRYLLPSPPPLVSAIVPTTGRPDLLEPCLNGLLYGTVYERLEVVVAVSEDTYDDPVRIRCLERAARDARVRVVAFPPAPFNFARTVNEAVSHANGDFLLLLNDDTEVIYDEWLEAMVGYALLDDVGAVGALLLHTDGTIQHAGMLVGARGVAEHLYSGRQPDISGYMGRARLPQDLSVVAATCMLVKRESFAELGGFEEGFSVCYNDIDFCLRLRRQGWRVVYVPDAALYHQETASFGTHQHGRDLEHRRDVGRMRERWGSVLLDDPMHNPNLALDASDPSRLAFPPRVEYPWRRGGPSGVQLSANPVGASSSSGAPVNV
jgi:GT2 family glycosyltransferase